MARTAALLQSMPPTCLRVGGAVVEPARGGPGVGGRGACASGVEPHVVAAGRPGAGGGLQAMGRAHDRQAQAEVAVESCVEWRRGRAGHTPAQQRAVQGWVGCDQAQPAGMSEGGSRELAKGRSCALLLQPAKQQEQDRHPLHRATAATAACTPTRAEQVRRRLQPIDDSLLASACQVEEWRAGGGCEGARGSGGRPVPCAQLAKLQPRMHDGCAGSKVVASTSPSRRAGAKAGAGAGGGPAGNHKPARKGDHLSRGHPSCCWTTTARWSRRGCLSTGLPRTCMGDAPAGGSLDAHGWAQCKLAQAWHAGEDLLALCGARGTLGQAA